MPPRELLQAGGLTARRRQAEGAMSLEILKGGRRRRAIDRK